MMPGNPLPSESGGSAGASPSRMEPMMPGNPLPSERLARLQADGLAGARSRLLRQAGIARRRCVLDVGCGWGHVSHELSRRSAGCVIAIDVLQPALTYGLAQARARAAGRRGGDVYHVRADATRLPLEDAACDLVFVQCVLLWLTHPREALAEAVRVLQPGGALVALEPDFGGLMAHPPEYDLRSLWLDVLRRCAADPLVGRRLPDWLRQVGLAVETRFLDRLEPADATYLELLDELPLTSAQQQQVADVRAAWSARAEPPTVHLPYWLVLGWKR